MRHRDGTGGLRRVGAVRVPDLAPGEETWWVDAGGCPVVGLAAEGCTPDLLRHLRTMWRRLCAPHVLAEVGPAPLVSYSRSPFLAPGEFVRVHVEAGLVLGVLHAGHAHPDTTAALGDVLGDIAGRYLAQEPAA